MWHFSPCTLKERLRDSFNQCSDYSNSDSTFINVYSSFDYCLMSFSRNKNLDGLVGRIRSTVIGSVWVVVCLCQVVVSGLTVVVV